jgi:hypothetical protein
VLVNDLPSISFTRKTKRFSHPEADAVPDIFFVPVYAHIAMTEGDISGNDDLKIVRLNFDRAVLGIQPGLHVGNVDSEMCARRL